MTKGTLPLTPNLDQHIFPPIGPAAIVSGEFECQPIAQVYFGSLNPVLLLLKARNRRRGAGAESNTGDLELQLFF
jgi:hypothetical protein